MTQVYKAHWLLYNQAGLCLSQGAGARCVAVGCVSACRHGYLLDGQTQACMANTFVFLSCFRTPTMAGGLFAINTAFFEHLGWYDPGYEVWGAENLELSFKVGSSSSLIPATVKHLGKCAS